MGQGFLDVPFDSLPTSHKMNLCFPPSCQLLPQPVSTLFEFVICFKEGKVTLPIALVHQERKQEEESLSPSNLLPFCELHSTLLSLHSTVDDHPRTLYVAQCVFLSMKDVALEVGLTSRREDSVDDVSLAFCRSTQRERPLSGAS